MFQSEPVLWLQSFASESLTSLLVLVSAIGFTKFYIALVLAITFGIRADIGLLLLRMVLWNEVLTHALKNTFALPRPAEIDSSVRLLGDATPDAAPVRSAAGRFWTLPDPAAIAYYRSLPHASFGFPSGHVSTATTFWVGTSALLRSRTLGAIGAGVILLTAVSRVYLGRHFLADVAGGLVLGLSVVLASLLVAVQRPIPSVFPGAGSVSRAPSSLGMALGLALPLLVLLLVPGLAPEPVAVGRLVGANAACLLLLRVGLPDDAGSVTQRLARAALAVMLYVSATVAVNALVRWAGLGHARWGEFLAGVLPPPAYLLGTVAIWRIRGPQQTVGDQ